jgi:uncharacterized protein YndB with AHSA1/START domain
MTKPDTFHVERSVTIQAPPEKVFAQISDFHAWQAWSPWEKLDPAMKKSFTGAPSGKGAAYAWESEKVGTGSMEILEAEAASGVKIKLDFLKPFEGHNIAQFRFSPEGGGTKVTWTMDGPANLVSKIMQVFMNMDKMIGPDFEAGLASLKAVAEKS